MKTVVIYCTHIINTELSYFMNNGYISNGVADFYFCFNGDYPIDQYTSHAQELGLNNIYFHQRPNVGHDFSGWSEILFLEKNGIRVHDLYDFFILINSSCMGPFVPLYVSNNWIEIFTNMITDNIKLVGPTINLYLGKPHIQSYMMCMDRIGLGIGMSEGVFTSSGFADLSKIDIINNCEVQFSLKILEAGYSIKSLLKALEPININEYYKSGKITNEFNLILADDNCYEGRYCKISFHPYEVIFFKSNRGIAPNILHTCNILHSINQSDFFSKIIRYKIPPIIPNERVTRLITNRNIQTYFNN